MFFSTSPDKRKKELVSWAKEYKIDALYQINAIENITHLDLSFKHIKKLPRQIDCLKNIETINLSYNSLGDLPWEFGNLKNLKSLDLSYNKFIELSGVVCKLENLEILDLSANQLKKVNSSIANLKKLRDLNLFANRIAELPSEFGSLSHLVKLNLALNLLSVLPPSFGKLYNIVELELWLNKFELIPDVISKLPNLKDLYNVVDPDRLNKTLIWAVIGDNTYLAEKLLFFGADVNYELDECTNHLLTTPLFEAISIDMINLLFEKGADPNLKREIIKHVVTKECEQIRPTGKFETFLTKKHSKEIQKFIKAYINGEPVKKVGHH